MADVAEQTSFTDPSTAISQGKRHLLVRDYTAAVTAFAEGLELLSQKHGDCGDELGEPYLLYGRALLGLAREEAGVLGGGVPGTDEGDEEDEDEDSEEKLSNGDEKEESALPVDSEAAAASVDKEVEKEKIEEKTEEKSNETDDSKIAEQKEDKADQPSEKKVDDSMPGSSKDEPKTNGECSKEKNGNIEENGEEDGEDVNKEDEDEDPGRGIDLQVAWEVLELAKIVFFKRGKPGFKQLAEAHRLLGEVAMESGNPEVAVSDLEKALTILHNIEPLDPRSMAELNYQLGLAHSLKNDFDASINHFNEATTLLESRIKELETTKETPKSDDPFYTVDGEINELKELLPEIQEKIADMKDFKQEACRLVIEGIKNKVAGSCTNGAGPSTEEASTSSSSSTNNAAPSAPQATKAASDISHLVRKKRKNDEAEPEIASPCKKPTP